MTLLTTVAAALAVIVSAILLAGAGKQVLRWLRVSPTSTLEKLLFSIALGTVSLELAVSLGEIVPNVRFGVIAAVAFTALLGLRRTFDVVSDLRTLWHSFRALPRKEFWLALGLGAVLALQGLASLAPVTGSDALHYHFTAQAFFLNNGFHADWSILHGFFCGLGHQLILAGLAFGSEKLATGWIYLGGLVGVVATLCLARRWADGVWPWLTALAFALTPVTFWQITSSGAPDIWMCAFLPLSVLAVLQAAETRDIRVCILAGILAGATAGAKYTGILMAGVLLLALVIELQSIGKTVAFFASALAVGFPPYVRNWIWTGDPIFPFWFSRRHNLTGNLDALHSLLKDTGASNPHGLFRVLRFPFFAIADGQGLATWQFLGPLILALGPIALLTFRKKPLQKERLWRVSLIVWLAVSLAIGMTSGIPRFLLPILPVALAASIGGVALLTQDRWPALRGVTLLSLAGFSLAGFGALVVYSQPAWSVVLGRISPNAYLRIHAPDFDRSQFVNRALAGQDPSGRALIFFRHLYYLRVPFVGGDPEDSWDANPAVLHTTQAWLDFFQRQQIRWVVKTGDYPIGFAESLARMERDGALRPCAAGTVENIQGFRMNGSRISEPITIFCVSANAVP